MDIKVSTQKKLSAFTLDITFTCRAGEVLVLFGPSGSGKSLTLKMISRIFPADAMDCNYHPRHHRIAHMLQGHRLFPHMTVQNNLFFAAKDISLPSKKEKAQKLIHDFQLAGLEDKYPKDISGGQQQRVALAQMLMQKPDLLLLDEPFTALDLTLKRQIISYLKSWQQQHPRVPIILVTHDLLETELMANRIIEINEGRMIQNLQTVSPTLNSLFVQQSPSEK